MLSRSRLRAAVASTLAGGAAMSTAGTATGQEALETIIVTATRRAQSVLDVPYNISALSAEDLARSNVTDFSKLSRMVAGLSYIDQGPDVRGNVNTFVLRGLGGSAADANAGVPRISTAPVSTYVGEAAVFFPMTTTDLERVEVLRGPQGTLYGAGSTGGTIRFIPKRPDTAQTTLEVSGELSNTDQASDLNYSFDALANLPVTGGLAARVVGGYREQAGFIGANGILAVDDAGAPVLADSDDVVGSLPVLLPRQEDVNEAESWYARASLLWNASDAVDFLLWWHHQDDEVGDRQAQNPEFEGDGFFPANGEYQQSLMIHEPFTREVDLVSLEATVDFGFATLTSATSWFDIQSTQTYDLSGFVRQFLWAYYYFFPRLTAPADETVDDTGFIQEFRLASRGGGMLDWVAGAFYQDSTSDYFSDNYVPGIREYYVALLGFDPGTEHGLVITRALESRDFALFGELTWHLTDAWQVTGGVRAFWGSFDQDYVQTLPLCGAPCANDGVDPQGTTAASSSVNYDDQVFKLNTSYDLTDHLIAYATWAQGYRHAGANALPTEGNFAEDPSLLEFGPDSANNYEVGLKGTIADRVQFSTAAFYITWEDFQFDTFLPVSNFPFVGNANEARSQGVELEVAAQVTNRLRATLGYTYTNAELTEDFAIGGVQGFEGDKMPGIPEHSLAWTVDYVHPFSGDYSLRFHVNGMYRSDTQSDWNTVTSFGRRYFPIDSFSVWDLSLSLLAGDRWSATAFVDNVGNEKGTTGGVPAANYSPPGAYFLVVPPLTVGLRLGYSWGK